MTGQGSSSCSWTPYTCCRTGLMVGELSFSVSRDAVVAFPLSFLSNASASISKARDSLSFREIDSLLEIPNFFTFSCAFICERAYLQEYPRPYALFSSSPTCDFSRPPRRYHDLPPSSFFCHDFDRLASLAYEKEKTAIDTRKDRKIDTGRGKRRKEKEKENHTTLTQEF